MPHSDLDGVCVLMTRPKGQGAGLDGLIRDAGGITVDLPLLQIDPVESPLLQSAEALSKYDTLIFVSANAVRYSPAWLAPAAFTGTQVIAAVGEATARSLAERGFTDVVTPRGGSSSEELLKCTALNRTAMRRVLIVRGQGGLESLAQGLRKRGAVVDYAEVYRRVPLTGDAETPLRHWLTFRQPVGLITSSEAFDVLLSRCPDSLLSELFQQSLVVLSERLASRCREAGWQGPVAICSRVTDQNLLDSVTSLVN